MGTRSSRAAPKPTANFSLDDVWAELDTASQRFPMRAKPAGAFTTSEYAARHKVDRGVAMNRLKLLAKEGIVESCGLVVTAGGGRVKAWRLLKKS